MSRPLAPLRAWFLLLALMPCLCTALAAEDAPPADKDAEPSAEAKAWALASDALLPASNGAALDRLEYRFPPDYDIDIKAHLGEWWGITNRAELLDMLKWLQDDGHRAEFDRIAAALAAPKDRANAAYLAELAKTREGAYSRSVVEKYREKVGKKSIMAWDLARCITIVRQGFTAGHIDEKEAWRLIMPIARKLKATFESWADLGENYLIGREFWSEERTKGEGKQFEYLYKNLLDDPASPWKAIPWDSKLD